jgi:hypothetical protein
MAATWPTPRANDAEKRGDFDGTDPRNGLPVAAQQWETPSVAVTAGSRLTRGGARSDEKLLTGQAVALSQQWSTLRASDGDKGGPNQSFGAGGVPLPAMVSQWTTPVATDTGRTTQYAQGGTALSVQAGSWATPQAHDSVPGNPERVGRFGTKAGGRNLTDEASGWPSPTARMYRGGGAAVTRSDGKSRLDMLDWAAEAFQASHPAPAIPDGETSSPPAPTSRPQLNARFAEWLMGWPQGWTSSGPSATEFARWQQDMRGELSTLCSRKPPQRLL